MQTPGVCLPRSDRCVLHGLSIQFQQQLEGDFKAVSRWKEICRSQGLLECSATAVLPAEQLQTRSSAADVRQSKASGVVSSSWPQARQLLKQGLLAVMG
jgi:hypothetical protein